MLAVAELRKNFGTTAAVEPVACAMVYKQGSELLSSEDTGYQQCHRSVLWLESTSDGYDLSIGKNPEADLKAGICLVTRAVLREDRDTRNSVRGNRSWKQHTMAKTKTIAKDQQMSAPKNQDVFVQTDSLEEHNEKEGVSEEFEAMISEEIELMAMMGLPASFDSSSRDPREWESIADNSFTRRQKNKSQRQKAYDEQDLTIADMRADHGWLQYLSSWRDRILWEYWNQNSQCSIEAWDIFYKEKVEALFDHYWKSEYKVLGAHGMSVSLSLSEVAFLLYELGCTLPTSGKEAISTTKFQFHLVLAPTLPRGAGIIDFGLIRPELLYPISVGKPQVSDSKEAHEEHNFSTKIPTENLQSDIPPKYWAQRYRFFSLFDEGIRLDLESWYSVTPESIAWHVAERCACDVLVDGFCGAGGNAIQFAFTCNHVIAIDIDPKKIEMARHNARIYGVADRIEFIVGDFFNLAPRLEADVLYLSPPWGGPEYLDKAVFDLNSMVPSIGDLRRTGQLVAPNVAYFLPRNSDMSQILSHLCDSSQSVEIEQHALNRKLKSICVYTGPVEEI